MAEPEQISEWTTAAADTAIRAAYEALAPMAELANGAATYFPAVVMIECTKAICAELGALRTALNDKRMYPSG